MPRLHLAICPMHGALRGRAYSPLTLCPRLSAFQDLSGGSPEETQSTLTSIPQHFSYSCAPAEERPAWGLRCARVIAAQRCSSAGHRPTGPPSRHQFFGICAFEIPTMCTCHSNARQMRALAAATASPHHDLRACAADSRALGIQTVRASSEEMWHESPETEPSRDYLQATAGI